jgi:hypothetical protein
MGNTASPQEAFNYAAVLPYIHINNAYYGELDMPGNIIAERRWIDTGEGDQEKWLAASKILGSTAAAVPFKDFGEPRFKVLERLEKEGIRHAAYVTMPLGEFLADSRGALEKIPSRRYHLYVEAKDSSGARALKLKDITLDEALERVPEIRQRCGDRGGLLMTYVEAPRLLYHGNVLVSHNGLDRGLVKAEFVDGDSPPVSRGGTVPPYVL